MLRLSTTARLLSVSLLLAITMPARAEPDANVQSFVLDNGLKVILAPSKTAQNVVLVTDYRVGSANETPGRSGFAHLFEHLMFEGTKAVPEFDKVVSAAGGENNAFTQDDDTVYYLTGPKESLPVFLRLDADRMANLAKAVTQEDLDNQRDVVLNEMRQNVLDQPGAAAQTQADAQFYPEGHPYAHATIGSIADLKSAKLEDVVAFHRTWYVPGNATVTVSGNFDPEQAKAWISRTFALVPKTEPAKAPTAAPLQPNPQRLEFSDAVPNAIVALSWPGPGGMSRETLVRSMVGQALSVGDNSLDNQLVVKQRVASGAHGGSSDGRLSGKFALMAVAAQGITSAMLDEALRATIADIQKQGFTTETLKTVLADYETGFASVPNDPLNYAMTLSSASEYVDPRDWRTQLDMAKTVKVDELNAVLRSLDTAQAQVTIINPGPRNSAYPAVIANATGESIAPSIAPRPDVTIADIQAEKAEALTLPDIAELALANGAGLTVYHVEDPAEVAVSVVVDGGASDAEPGLGLLAMSVQQRGAGNKSLAELDVAMRDKGISVSGSPDRHKSFLLAKAPVKQFEPMLQQLAESIRAPRFDDKEWAAAVDQTASYVERMQKQPDYQAGRALKALVYPAGSPETRIPDSAQVRALKRADAEALFKALMRPDRVHFHVAGSIAPEAVKAALDKAFDGWKAEGKAKPLATHTPPALQETRKDVQVDGATQAAIAIAMPAPDEGTREALAFALAVETLGGSFNSRLNSVLREEKGWSYGISAGANGDKGQNDALLTISTLVQSDKTGPALDEIKSTVQGFAAKPVTVEELDAAKRINRSQIASTFESAVSLASFAGQIAAQGYMPQDFRKYLSDLDAITLEEVNRQVAIIAKSPMAIAVAGDKVEAK